MKEKKRYVCKECGCITPKWMGKCPECGSWNSIIEEAIIPETMHFTSYNKPPVLMDDVVYSEDERISTCIKELDQVLGGGIVPGSLILIGGDPGIGKSTLMLQACGKLSQNNKVLYVSGEESEKQIKLRAGRLKITGGYLYIYCENDINAIENSIKDLSPAVVIIDSIQTIYAPEIETAPGSISQIRECTLRLIKIAKQTEAAIFVVGHVTKEGNLAGPKLLEHMVDCVLYFEGERYYSYRLLRAVKNRFGSTNEIGIFEMNESGLDEVKNPSKYLLAGKLANTAGSTVVCIMEGTRPLLVEVQALVSTTGYNLPRRQTSGIDYNRMALLIAVLEKKVGLALAREDVFVNVAGGIKIDEPAADLAVALAIASSFRNKPVCENTIIIGEVGLAGEVRSVSYIDKRLQEASKLGFLNAIIPYENSPTFIDTKMNIVRVKTLGQAISMT